MEGSCDKGTRFKKIFLIQQQYHQNFQNQTAEAHIRLDLGLHLRLDCGKSIPAFQIKSKRLQCVAFPNTAI